MTYHSNRLTPAEGGRSHLEFLCDRLQQQPNQRLRRKLGRRLMRQIVNLIDEPASGQNEARHLAAVDSAWAALEEAVYQHPERLQGMCPMAFWHMMYHEALS